MFYNMSFEDIRSLCKNNIESLELWVRRLIHQKLSEAYGSDYLHAKDMDGEPIANKKILEHYDFMIESNPPGRFQRPVDALFFEHLIHYLCNDKYYQRFFKKALKHKYPQGNNEVREFLNRIVPIRNALSHSNPISVRQAEQAVCYSNDFIDGLKQYYKDKGEEQMWNVPTIIKFTDSLGNVLYPESINKDRKIPNGTFHVGDTYSLTVEIDASFNRDEYTIDWYIQNSKPKEYLNKESISITFDNSLVSERCLMMCEVISNKEWHKQGDYDDAAILELCVMPAP